MAVTEERIKDIENRLKVQESYTKNLTPNGDLKRVLNIVPLLVLTTTLGIVLGYNFYHVLKSK